MQQRAVDVGVGGVEAQRVEQRMPVVAADRERAGVRIEEELHVAMRLHRALGRPVEPDV
jgi:hypothetical protein